MQPPPAQKKKKVSLIFSGLVEGPEVLFFLFTDILIAQEEEIFREQF